MTVERGYSSRPWSCCVPLVLGPVATRLWQVEPLPLPCLQLVAAAEAREAAACKGAGLRRTCALLIDAVALSHRLGMCTCLITQHGACAGVVRCR